MPPEPWGNGHEMSFAIVIFFGVFRLCNLGLFGEFCAELVREPGSGRPWGAESAVGELGPSTRSFVFGDPVPIILSAFERSSGVSLLAALSMSDFRTLVGSSLFFLLPSAPKKDRFFFSAAFLACRPDPMAAVGSSPEATRREPVASAAPSGLVLIGASLVPFIIAFEGAGTFSAELSSRSVESPSLMRRGMPRTGVSFVGSSSSLESAKRLLAAGRG